MKNYLSKLILFAICSFVFGWANTSSAQNFQWAKQMGGTNHGVGQSIAIDGSGNNITAGSFQGTGDFDPGAAVYNLISEGTFDIFITKLDASGNFVWAKRIGGANEEHLYSMTIDDAGNIYATGVFQGTTDFDPGIGVFNMTSAGGENAFILKLDSGGNLIWARSFGGTSLSWGVSIKADTIGNVYCTGGFLGTADFDPGPGIFNLTSIGDVDAFIIKLDSFGNLMWVKNIGGPDEDSGSSIAVDASGNVLVGGSFFTTADFDPGAGIFNLTSSGWTDVFILKLDALGNFIWVKQIGGADYDISQELIIDSNGNIHVLANFTGTADFDPGASIYNLTSTGSFDCNITKLDPSGNFIWARSWGSTLFDEIQSLVFDGSGNAISIGIFSGIVDFDPGVGIYNLTAAGLYDIFISKLNATGDFIWAHRIGSVEDDFGTSLATDANGNIYATGAFRLAVDFDPGPGIFNLTAAPGNSDVFVLKLDGGPTGISELNSQNEIIIYPNPTSGTINIVMDEIHSSLEIKTYDLFGRLTQTKQINTVQSFQLNIDGPAGMYFVSVKTGDTTKTIKVLKQ